MKEFVKLERKITEDDKGKRVKLRNGDIGEILACYGEIIEIEGDHSYFHKTDGTYYQEDTKFDIIEIEEEVVKSDLFQFQVGDIVEFGGVEGKVVLCDNSNIEVELKAGEKSYFTSDGRYSISNLKPLLNLVSRPKKKEKRVVKVFVDYSSSIDRVFTLDYRGPTPDDLVRVELEKEIEVEV